MTFIKSEEQNIVQKTETINGFLEYSNQIVFVELKEFSEATIESITEHFKILEELAGTDNYVVLVDGTKTLDAPPEVRQIIANHNPPNRLATAILINNKNIALNLIINFYLKVNKPKVQTKLFSKRTDAISWLNEILKTADK